MTDVLVDDCYHVDANDPLPPTSSAAATRSGVARTCRGARWRCRRGSASSSGPPHGFVFPNLLIAEESIFVIASVGVAEMTHLQKPITPPVTVMHGAVRATYGRDRSAT